MSNETTEKQSEPAVPAPAAVNGESEAPKQNGESEKKTTPPPPPPLPSTDLSAWLHSIKKGGGQGRVTHAVLAYIYQLSGDTTEVPGSKKSSTKDSEFVQSLKDGTRLCKAANGLADGSIAADTISADAEKAKHIENLQKFNEFLKSKADFADDSIINAEQLSAGSTKAYMPVLTTLCKLAMCAQEKFGKEGLGEQCLLKAAEKPAPATNGDLGRQGSAKLVANVRKGFGNVQKGLQNLIQKARRTSSPVKKAENAEGAGESSNAAAATTNGHHEEKDAVNGSAAEHAIPAAS